MRGNLTTTLDYISKVAAILAVIADAGKKVMSLCEG